MFSRSIEMPERTAPAGQHVSAGVGLRVVVLARIEHARTVISGVQTGTQVHGENNDFSAGDAG